MNTEEGLQFLSFCNDLKHLPRRGWVLSGIEHPESVADHSWRVAMMSFLINDPQVDTYKCMRIGLVHDLAESVVGDITPSDNVAIDDKHMREKGMEKITSHLRPEQAREIQSYFLEYENQETLESHYVYDFDKMDMLIQAKDYEYKYGIDLSQFFESTTEFKTEWGKEYLKAVVAQRKCNQH